MLDVGCWMSNIPKWEMMRESQFPWTYQSQFMLNWAVAIIYLFLHIRIIQTNAVDFFSFPVLLPQTINPKKYIINFVFIFSHPHFSFQLHDKFHPQSTSINFTFIFFILQMVAVYHLQMMCIIFKWEKREREKNAYVGCHFTTSFDKMLCVHFKTKVLHSILDVSNDHHTSNEFINGPFVIRHSVLIHSIWHTFLCHLCD